MKNHLKGFTIIYILLILSLFSSCVLQTPKVEEITEASLITSTPLPTPSEIAVIPTLEIKVNEEVRIKDADEALAFADYDRALDLYTKAYDTASNSSEKAAALFGICLTNQKTENYPLVLINIKDLLNNFPDELPAMRANLILAETYQSLERYDEAISYYNTYLTIRPGIIDSYVYESMGDIYSLRGEYSQALDAYKSAYIAPKVNDGESIAIKIANTYSNLGDLETALSLYENIYFESNSDYTKAQMDISMGRSFILKGETSLAYERYQDAVNNFPQTYDAFSALAELVNNNQEVDELQRGKINANIGQYNLAIEAYDRYMAQPNADIPSAIYFKALAVRALGVQNAPFGSSPRLDANKENGTQEDNQAIALWKQLISEYPNHQYVVDAWEDIAYTQSAYMDDPVAGALTSKEYVADEPDSPYASRVLFSAGRYFEIAGELPQAAETWSRLGIEYPSTNETFQALLFAGITYYRLNDLDNALLAFNKGLVLSLDPLETAAAYLWIGKIYDAQEKIIEANDFWRKAVQTDPFGYYGLRARELLENRQPFEKSELLNLSYDLETEKQEAGEWLINSLDLPLDIDLGKIPHVITDERIIRGQEFWSLGKYSLAKTEFESMRADYNNDPAALFNLISIFLDLGFYRSAIESARTIIGNMAINTADIEKYPSYFSHIIFGLYYLPWIEEFAAQYDVPLLFLYSLIYQESHFDGFVTSAAGAKGLMQIMPATGSQIASEINWPSDFQVSDLSVPYINLRLGTNYLARQIYLFDGDLYASAVAYNSGPGNALAWKEISGDDPDLFLGSVRFLETRSYVRNITEIHSVYAQLYGN